MSKVETAATPATTEDLAKLLKEEERKFIGLCIKRLHSGNITQSPEDCLQQAAYKTIKKIREGEKIYNLRGYFRYVLNNLIMDINKSFHTRKSRNNPHIPRFVSEDNAQEHHAETNEYAEIMYKAMNDLSQKDQQVIILHLAGLGVAEITTQLHSTSDAIYMALSRARMRLKSAIVKQFNYNENRTLKALGFCE